MCPSEKALELAEAIRVVKTTVRPCSICYNLTEGEICHICADPRRDGQADPAPELLRTGAVGLLDRVAPLCFAAPVFFHSVRWYFQLRA